jgi:hypothetical protein
MLIEAGLVVLGYIVCAGRVPFNIQSRSLKKLEVIVGLVFISGLLLALLLGLLTSCGLLIFLLLAHYACLESRRHRHHEGKIL